MGRKVGAKKPIKFSGAVERAKKALVKKPVPVQTPVKSRPNRRKHAETEVEDQTADFAELANAIAGPSNSAPDMDTELPQTPVHSMSPFEPMSGLHPAIGSGTYHPSPEVQVIVTSESASAEPFSYTIVSTGPETLTRSDADEVSSEMSAAAKRKSGWTKWLRKIAAEKTRTLEEWHEERMKRRRGIAWMNMMIAEFGVAPSPATVTPEAYADGRKPAGSSASFANSLAAQGLGSGGIRNLGGPKNVYRTDNWNKTRQEEMRRTADETDKYTPVKRPAGEANYPSRRSGYKKAQRAKNALKTDTEAGTPAPMARPDGTPLLEHEITEVAPGEPSTIVPSEHLSTAGPSHIGPDEPADTPVMRRDTEKKAAIAKRNGAPMGWAFVDPNATAPRQLEAEPELLPRTARRARQYLNRTDGD